MTALEPANVRTPSDALAARLVSDASSPLITYYDTDSGERIEVSALTFANWVAKSANLLRDGLGLATGPRVAVSQRTHWQSIAMVHAVWALGGSVATNPIPAGHYDVEICGADSVDTALSRADDVIVMALRPMAMPGEPVQGPATDFDRDVRSYGDHFSGSPVRGDAAALEQPSGSPLSHHDVMDWAKALASRTRTQPDRPRLALDASTMATQLALVAPLVAMEMGVGIVMGATALPPALLDQERAAAWQPVAEAEGVAGSAGTP